MNIKITKQNIDFLDNVDPRSELFNIITRRVHFEEKKKAFKQFVAFSFMSLFSVLALVATTIQFVDSMNSSGFLQYLSLLLSDGVFIISNINYYILSITESFPVTEVTGSLIALFACFYSVKSIISNYKVLQYFRKKLA